MKTIILDCGVDIENEIVDMICAKLTERGYGIDNTVHYNGLVNMISALSRDITDEPSTPTEPPVQVAADIPAEIPAEIAAVEPAPLPDPVVQTEPDPVETVSRNFDIVIPNLSTMHCIPACINPSSTVSKLFVNNCTVDNNTSCICFSYCGMDYKYPLLHGMGDNCISASVKLADDSVLVPMIMNVVESNENSCTHAEICCNDALQFGVSLSTLGLAGN